MVVSVIGTVQMFEPFLLMPGPSFSTRTLSLYTYELGFRALNLGYGAAVSLIIFVLLLFATVYQALGIDVSKMTLPDLSGRPQFLVEDGAQPMRELI